jgi:hypothetical protein
MAHTNRLLNVHWRLDGPGTCNQTREPEQGAQATSSALQNSAPKSQIYDLINRNY